MQMGMMAKLLVPRMKDRREAGLPAEAMLWISHEFVKRLRGGPKEYVVDEPVARIRSHPQYVDWEG